MSSTFLGLLDDRSIIPGDFDQKLSQGFLATSKRMMKPQHADYRAWADKDSSLPIWHQPWWLDATAGPEAWDVAMVTHGSDVLAVLPYVKRSKLLLNVLTQPPLTQSLGPWFSGGVGPALSQQHRILDELLSALPSAAAYQQNWMPEMTNWLPFYWDGYQQSTRYTYRLSLNQVEEQLWGDFSGRARTSIRRAMRHVEIREDPSVEGQEHVWNLVEGTFARQGQSVPFTRQLFDRILTQSLATQNGSVLIAVDATGAPHAAGVFVHDKERTYYLLGGVSPSVQHSGSMNYVLWEAIKSARARGSSIFDFEGSMIPSIEFFFRSFGAQQTPYSRVWFFHSRLLRTAMGVRRR